MPRLTMLEILFVVFLRLVSACCFAFGLFYWGKLVGFTDGGLMRFDLMTTPWKIAATSLAVLYPVVALGLWLSVSWGPVLWVVAASAEMAMYNVWPELFEPRPMVMVMHSLVALCYCLFRAGIWYTSQHKDLARKK